MNAGGLQPKLSVRQASKVYHTSTGDVTALDRISLDVRRNEVVSVVGPSGCGKTTLLWCMSGLHAMSGGEVLIDGQKITGPHPDIGIVFQEANLLPWRSIESNINFPFEIKKAKPDRAWVDHLLRRVGLEGFGAKMPRELSGGMQQRAAIVRALSQKPSVLLMDEPFGALDSFTRDEMNRLVEEIWLDSPTTIVFITHSIEEAIFLSNRVVVLTPRPGRVAQVHDVPFARPRSFDVMATREVFDLTNAIKRDIVGGRSNTPARARVSPKGHEMGVP